MRNTFMAPHIIALSHSFWTLPQVLAEAQLRYSEPMRKYLDEVRWGIVGCGEVCERKSGPPLYQTPHSQLVAVMRRDGDKARDFAARHGVPRAYDDAQALISDPDVNAVYIATPPGSHEELALLVARAGKPCYVEKPMARSFAECERMNHAFAERDLPLFVAFYRRALARFTRAKSLIDEGTLGIISSVRYEQTQPARDAARLNWRVDAETAGAGLFLDLGSHTLDILDFLLGPLRNVRGSAVNMAGMYAVEDSVSLSFATQSGALGAASWNFAGSLHKEELCIDGTQGRLQMSVFGFEPVRLVTASGTRELADEEPAHVQSGLMANIVASLRGEAQPLSTGESATRTSRVMDQALQEFYAGRDGAFWSRPETWQPRPWKRLP
jgi:1,5-anhydro-D-fructose reductase (1,5-anhydro-D-mannitol-forming)